MHPSVPATLPAANESFAPGSLRRGSVELQQYSYADLCGIAIMDACQEFREMDNRLPSVEEIIGFKEGVQEECTMMQTESTTVPTKGDANVLGVPVRFT